MLPSTVTWVGPSSGGDWGTAANWSTNALPGSGDDVVIPANISLTHSQNSADTINSLTTGAGDALGASSGSLTISAHSAIDPSFVLSIGGGTVSFNASVPETVTLASLYISSNQYIGYSTMGGTDNFVVTGSFTWAGGMLAGPAGSTLTAQGGMTLSTNIRVGEVLDGRDLINSPGQTATFTGGLVDMFDQAIFDNEGAMSVTGDTLLGTYSYTAQNQAQTLGPPQVINNGSIDVNVPGGRWCGPSVMDAGHQHGQHPGGPGRAGIGALPGYVG